MKRGALRIQRAEFSDEFIKKDRSETRKLNKEMARLAVIQDDALKEIDASERLVNIEKKRSLGQSLAKQSGYYNSPITRKYQSTLNLVRSQSDEMAPHRKTSTSSSSSPLCNNPNVLKFTYSKSSIKTKTIPNEELSNSSSSK